MSIFKRKTKLVSRTSSFQREGITTPVIKPVLKC